MYKLSNTKGAATLSDNQVYGPYGNLLYSANGSMGTAKGYTGQYSDPLTGLDYYVSRYYDPVAGIFLSADTKEGNAQGMNPYAYVAQNPETLTDPSGQMIVCPPGGCGGGGGGNPTPPPPAPPNHGPTCGSDPSSCGGGGMKNPGAGGSEQPKTTRLMTYGETLMSPCDTTCQQEEQAYETAEAARDHFAEFAANLSLPGWLDVILGGISYRLFQELFESAFFTGFLAALTEISSIAEGIANGFKQETDQVDLRKGQGLGWFNLDNVLRSTDQITSNIVNVGLANWFGSYGAAFASLLIAAFDPDPEPISHGVITSIFLGIAIGALTYGTMVGIGAAILYDQAQFIYINQEVSDAPCTDPAGCNYSQNYP